MKVQGGDRMVVQYVAGMLGLEGSYIPRTYIEQIQLEKLVNEVMALPDDLKTKLSLDEDLVSSPKEALLRASADRVAMRNKNMKSGISRSFTTQRDSNLCKMTSLASNQRFDDRNQESAAVLANQGAITQLSEQISSLNDKMDEFTSCVEELISKLPTKGNSPSQQNMAHQAEACNGSAPTSYFISGLGNGSLTGAKMHSSSSSSQLAKDSNLMEEISGIARGQRQVIHQLDALSSFLREGLGERSRQIQAERKRKEDRQVVLAVAGVTLSCLGLCIIAGSRS
ncbi:hypothetical protein Tsubulata_015570 [Turnera subulata]|uniref:Uncharacterized protein n=1 Tax=Turnera subulata TaxID=218843 RepID=A0A9Q0FNT7_9ROSI|nr:hypothetical protein Tsubulata_015570 [Turnera subulata]